jgi:hypothetical protein
MMKTMDKMMERMDFDNKPNTRERADDPPRNQIRPAIPQIIQINQGDHINQGHQRNQGVQRNQGNQGDQQIRNPFQNNYVNGNYDGYFEDNMNCCDANETEVFFTKEEHDQFMDANEIFMQDEEERLSVEREDYEEGLNNAIMQFQRQYNLRNQKVPANPPKGNPPKGNPTKEAQNNIPSSSQPKKYSPAKDVLDKGKQKEDPQKKILETRKEIVNKEVEKTSSSFNFESEMAKIKIFVPFNELIKNIEYRNQIIKMLKMEHTSDTLNIQDDHPAILFGPRVEESDDVDEAPPFYVSLKIHDMTPHNAMLDSGASHNLMPKVVMDQLGQDIIRPYKDLFSFDSRKVKCLGLIKYWWFLCLKFQQRTW